MTRRRAVPRFPATALTVFLAAALAVVAALLPVPAALAAPPAQPTPGPHDATSRHSFSGVDQWVKIFDDPKRADWQKPEEVVKALGLKPGMIVADLGAGTGYFERPLSKAVAPGGIVLAVDTDTEMVRHLADRTRLEATKNVIPVLADPDQPFLPAGRVDLVLIVDTYHHIDDRLHYFRRMKESMAPGGRVAIVDFHKRPMPVGPPLEHKLPREFVLDEMKQAGWTLAGEETFLPYQYLLVFAPAAGRQGA
jgi:ubiquinone/menaquinone biosynthesis C-methylase UbiE